MSKKNTTNNRSVISSVHWEDLLNEFLLWKSAQGIAKRTLDDYTFHVNQFFSRFPDAWGDFPTLRKCLLAYLAELKAPATKNLRLTYLKAFFGWCVTEGYLPDNPAAGIKRAKDEGRIRHISL
ncbi:MAG: hypothetical protein IMW96_08945 [Thermoanaerobacteraceae bacterium]|nr:hypothetical protein [Thermoanaerobacteraceae bacterium]